MNSQNDYDYDGSEDECEDEEVECEDEDFTEKKIQTSADNLNTTSRQIEEVEYDLAMIQKTEESDASRAVDWDLDYLNYDVDNEAAKQEDDEMKAHENDPDKIDDLLDIPVNPPDSANLPVEQDICNDKALLDKATSWLQAVAKKFQEMISSNEFTTLKNFIKGIFHFLLVVPFFILTKPFLNYEKVYFEPTMNIEKMKMR